MSRSAGAEKIGRSFWDLVHEDFVERHPRIFLIFILILICILLALAAAISSHILTSAYGDEANPLESATRLSSSLAAILDRLPLSLDPAKRGPLAEPTPEGAAAPQLDLRERSNDQPIEERALYGLEAGSSAEALPDGEAAPADPLAPDPEATELGKERLAEGVRLAEAGLFAEAIQAFDDVIAQDPEDALAWRYKGMANLAQGMDDEAVFCLERSLTIESADGVAWYSLGVALHNMGRHEEALDAYDQAVAIPGGWPEEEILTGRGMALGELGRYDAALTSFEAALAIDPYLTEAQYGKGYALLALGREAEGEEALLLAEEMEVAKGSIAQ